MPGLGWRRGGHSGRRVPPCPEAWQGCRDIHSGCCSVGEGRPWAGSGTQMLLPPRSPWGAALGWMGSCSPCPVSWGALLQGWQEPLALAKVWWAFKGQSSAMPLLPPGAPQALFLQLVPPIATAGRDSPGAKNFPPRSWGGKTQIPAPAASGDSRGREGLGDQLGLPPPSPSPSRSRGRFLGEIAAAEEAGGPRDPS